MRGRPEVRRHGHPLREPRARRRRRARPAAAELLVYQPTKRGKLRLGAVEYFQADADQDLATDTDRPWLFGVPFDGPMLGHNPEMPIHYDLHVWLYRHNPAGIFAMWNPLVRCPR